MKASAKPKHGWWAEFKNPRLWKGWRHLCTFYDVTRSEALEKAKEARGYYEGTSNVRVVPGKPLEKRLPEKGWTYSPYRAMLRFNGANFAIVTPDGIHELSPEKAKILLDALNRK